MSNSDKNFIQSQIKLIANDKQMSIKALSRDLEVPYQTLMNYSNGSREPKWDFLRLLHESGINLDWFVTGKGEMYRVKRDTSTTTINVDNNSREARLYRFIHEFLVMADDDQSAWFEVQLSRCFPEYKQWKKQNDY